MKPKVFLDGADLLGCLEPVNLGHVEIHEYKFVAFAVFLIHSHALFPASGQVHCLTELLQHHFHELRTKRVVVHYHHLLRLRGSLRILRLLVTLF
jgi:hypothetical protein